MLIDFLRRAGVSVIFITTRPKAETPGEEPLCFGKFAALKSHSIDVEKMRSEGYTHYLTVNNPRITVGGVYHEYRLLSAMILFKGEPPPFEDILEGKGKNRVYVVETRKHYSQMTGIGTSKVYAKLKPKEVAAWAKFFECTPGEVGPIEHLLH